MLRHKSGVILRQMQALLGAGTFGGLSDQQLLEQFLERRDEVAELAFAVLVERHGPMVLGVCRRVLRDPHDAEDAFQATFLVLARKGRSIRVEGSLGRWLFGVATRVATRARSDEMRRRGRERSGLDRVDLAAPEVSPTDADRAEIQAVIAMEIAGLPARFQAAVLLCDLEGRSYEEAARRLGWPVGTVKSRLSRGRARLRDRLTRRGLAPADLSVVTALLPVAPSSILVATTTRTALALISGRLTTAAVVSASVATLTQGVLRTMILTKIKFAAAGILLVATGSAVLFGQGAAPKAAGAGAGQAITRSATVAKSDEEIDLEMLERAWTDAVTRHDAAVINRILADDFEGIDQAGDTFDKPAALRDLLHGTFITDAFTELERVKARVFGDTAIVTSRFKGHNSSARGLVTHVYILRQRRWQCVASHASWATGGVCPAVGPIAEMDRNRNSVAEARNPLRPFATAAQNCTVCHVATPKENFHPSPPYSARPPEELKERPGKTLHVEIDGDGHVTMEGRPVAAEKKALEDWLRAGKEKMGRDELVVAASADAPYWIVARVSTAAQSVGLHQVRFEPLAGPSKSRTTGELSRPDGGPANRDHRVTSVRPPVDGRVDRIHVGTGAAVKKGDPLIEIFSTDLAAAKAEYEMALSQWQRDKKVYDYKKPLAESNTIPTRERIDAENDETQSRLKLKLARDRLLLTGLTDAEIGKKELGLENARLTLRSPVDGVVIGVGAVLGNFYDRKDVLIRIRRATPAQDDPKP